jgi:hypothetical protein
MIMIGTPCPCHGKWAFQLLLNGLQMQWALTMPAWYGTYCAVYNIHTNLLTTISLVVGCVRPVGRISLNKDDRELYHINNRPIRQTTRPLLRSQLFSEVCDSESVAMLLACYYSVQLRCLQQSLCVLSAAVGRV